MRGFLSMMLIVGGVGVLAGIAGAGLAGGNLATVMVAAMSFGFGLVTVAASAAGIGIIEAVAANARMGAGQAATVARAIEAQTAVLQPMLRALMDINSDTGEAAMRLAAKLAPHTH